MAYLIPLFILFLSAVVFSSWQKRKSDSYSLLNENKLPVNMVVPPSGFLSGILRKAAVKSGLLALFTIITPRRGSVAAMPLKPAHEVAEILELFRDIANRPENAGVAVQMLGEIDSSLRWSMQYAAEYYLRQSDRRDDIWQLFIQGVILLKGKASLAEAGLLLHRVADSGFLPACTFLSDLYLSQGAWDKALQGVIAASEAGYVPAIHCHAYNIYLSTLGKLFQHRSMSEAFRLFSSAAEKGFPPALTVVGEMYLQGYGAAVAPDPSIALYYLERAYKAGESSCIPLLRRARAVVGECILGF